MKTVMEILIMLIMTAVAAFAIIATAGYCREHEKTQLAIRDEIIENKTEAEEYASHRADAAERLNGILIVENKRLREQVELLATVPETEPEETVSAPANVPEGPTNMFMCMDYRKITNTRSDQYLLQTECSTALFGTRNYNATYYTVALAAYYGRDIGDTWLVRLDNGFEFRIMLGDFKDDGNDPTRMGDPCMNYEGEQCTNVIEFIVDMDNVSSKVKLAGTLSAISLFNGNIVEMTYEGRKWGKNENA